MITAQAVIFDLDGVLVDSARVVARVWREWAQNQGVTAPDLVRVALSLRSVEAVQRLAPHLDADREAQLLEAAEASDLDDLETMPGARDLIDALPVGSWGIFTSVTGNTALARLNRTGLPRPKVLVTAEAVQRGKPDPQGYLLAAQGLGLAAQCCVAIEDSPSGIQAAQAAGMQVIGLASTHPAEELQEANLVVETLNDIQVRLSRGMEGPCDLVIHINVVTPYAVENSR